MATVDCWQAKKCGREPGGAKVAELGVCAASTFKRLDGVHHGRNGGRACWALSGTLCGGKVQGTFAAKLATCLDCAFYKQVKAEEGPSLLGTNALLTRIG